jgi:hypothetical protein
VRGEWLGFTSPGSYLLQRPWNETPDADWIVTDWWASLQDKLPFRHERSMQDAQDYRLHVLQDASDWQQLLQRSHDPAWLLLDQPVSWLRKEWLLRDAASTPAWCRASGCSTGC